MGVYNRGDLQEHVLHEVCLPRQGRYRIARSRCVFDELSLGLIMILL